ncbi:MAG: DUF2723 domain-containing protein [Bacteroidales bacterium]
MNNRYKVINNSLGWLMFLVAAVTYMLTLEPTTSFWDCGEFIAQGSKLEVGHPPGNPIFMLAARFFVNFAPDSSYFALAVNTMSALLSAATILLLFWSITHLVKRLVVKEDGSEMSLAKMLVIFGSGAVGALAYTWSDTFWYSAVEGEVYAFSSFCTALVFWLILKWEVVSDRADSDRYLILIAYVLGISIAVHLLNLLCIPAIVLVFYYRKYANPTVKGSLIALMISFVIIALILYGLVPGFIEVAQVVELFCVNTLGMPFNAGVIVYALLVVALFGWSIYELYTMRSAIKIKGVFFVSILSSGILFFGDGVIIGLCLLAALGVYLFYFCKRVPVRVFNVIIISMFVIFIGYSSYAVILIRSNAKPPMDQNSPDNVFALSSYLNREQYGQTPLFYGQTMNSGVVYQEDATVGVAVPIVEQGKAIYAKDVNSEQDKYIMTGYEETYMLTPELNMLFPRMYSGTHAREYNEWTGMKGKYVTSTTDVDRFGNTIKTATKVKPTFMENMQYFLDYQLNYMYWRYFMWNFAGRQNDLQGNGEITKGNWITGISALDTMRLGNQSLLPSDYGSGNAGHNKFYLLPLVLGIIGLLWQAYAGKRGIEQFWVVFFLFFMTGLAIVLYLNQTPGQPRERDYAYAGSFYAFAIWIGMGVAGLWNLIISWMSKKSKKDESDNTIYAAIAVVLGLIVPFQMVSQTWDDHDRSGRYTARDFGMNYLSSIGENGIIFTNGDNDTFPLWYAQEVEGFRTDVRVINLSYLTTDWYIDQMRYPVYESAPISMLADKSTFAYTERQMNYMISPDTLNVVPVLESLKQLYSKDDYKNNYWGLPEVRYTNMVIPVDADSVIANGILNEDDYDYISDIELNMLKDRYTASEGAMSASKIMTMDIIGSNAADGWKRPIYFAMTVPEKYYLGLMPYLRSTGMAYELVPIRNMNYTDGEYAVNTEKMYDNVVNKFRWGGLDTATAENPIYLDETVNRMVTTTRSTMSDLAYYLAFEALQLLDAIEPDENGNYKLNLTAEEYADVKGMADDKLAKAREVLALMESNLPREISPLSVQLGYRIAQIYLLLGSIAENEEDIDNGLALLRDEILRYGEYARFYQSLSPVMYSRISSTDSYIDRSYIRGLLQLYNQEASEDETEALLEELAVNGVNVNRLFSGQ